MRILIAGGSGFLGTALGRRLEQEGHTVVVLTRHEPGPGQIRWDPTRAALDVGVVDEADVVVNLCGSSLFGNPYSASYARSLFESRVDTTRTLAEAIATSDRKPAFLAQNGSSWYGDHGEVLVTEDSDSRGDALLTRVTRDWQAATEPAGAAGARTCVLRSAPVFGTSSGRKSLVTHTLGRVFRLGLGGRLGNGRQYFPLVSAHDWVEAVTLLATDARFAGPVNLATPEPTTNAEFTEVLGEVLHRPAVVPVPTPLIRMATGPMAPELLSSVRIRPEVLLGAGFEFRHPDVHSVLAHAYAG